MIILSAGIVANNLSISSFFFIQKTYTGIMSKENDPVTKAMMIS